MDALQLLLAHLNTLDPFFSIASFTGHRVYVVVTFFLEDCTPYWRGILTHLRTRSHCRRCNGENAYSPTISRDESVSGYAVWPLSYSIISTLHCLKQHSSNGWLLSYDNDAKRSKQKYVFLSGKLPCRIIDSD